MMQKDDGFIELIHVYGIEKDRNFKYSHGNEAPHWGLYNHYRDTANFSGYFGLTVLDLGIARLENTA